MFFDKILPTLGPVRLTRIRTKPEPNRELGWQGLHRHTLQFLPLRNAAAAAAAVDVKAFGLFVEFLRFFLFFFQMSRRSPQHPGPSQDGKRQEDERSTAVCPLVPKPQRKSHNSCVWEQLPAPPHTKRRTELAVSINRSRTERRLKVRKLSHREGPHRTPAETSVNRGTYFSSPGAWSLPLARSVFFVEEARALRSLKSGPTPTNTRAWHTRLTKGRGPASVYACS